MITRFAPSPTGPLHLGHAFSALTAQAMAAEAQGQFLLRMDDIDASRARPEWDAQIQDDLRWLGVTWHGRIWRQSAKLALYQSALHRLSVRGLLYPCSCSRRDIEAAASAPQEGDGIAAKPRFGPDGRIYPGTCRGRPMASQLPGDAIRLDLSKALPPEPLAFTETGPAHAGRHIVTAKHLLEQIGDPVLARPNLPASYHLSVVIDDATQRVSDVVRGEDLFEATFLHRYLQYLLSLPTPRYHHHRLIRDEDGKRLAKRDDARAIATYRADGASPADVREMVGL
ncbi:MAG: tRNA glutamyl-Q(34) synthetase GluQRS [Pseudomonadota bacterium]